ncbi:SsgA family sporulation/cell division regulator [Lentzea aerocolonigenes]|uniref:SsgA family sporulation/cell division regulator n=1 Tax=Lentzea aerocolonigenes TaxID=68170 RepID=UPI0006967B68|nr:SsgA family sporulation/cell division regulator [Lentzea aerocolonigenes]
MDHVVARTTTTVRLHTGDGLPVREIDTQLRYDSRDPLVISFVFLLHEQNVLWALGRDLVAAGLIAPAGYGDVVLRPDDQDPGRVEFWFTDGGEGSKLSAPLSEIAAFVDRTHELVPMGEEWLWLDLDAELAKVLPAVE